MSQNTATDVSLTRQQRELLDRLRTPTPRIELPSQAAGIQAARLADRADAEMHKALDDEDYRGADGIMAALLAVAAELRALRYTMLEGGR